MQALSTETDMADSWYSVNRKCAMEVCPNGTVTNVIMSRNQLAFGNVEESIFFLQKRQSD
jgi:hypothetical protein